jgi:ketosteroid isomerase-like protein
VPVTPSNIEIVFAGWLDAIRRGDVALMEQTLAPEVVHHGIRPDWACNGRQEVLDMQRGRVLPDVEALELVAAGDKVVMSVRSPQVGVPLADDGPPRGQACIVFTLAGGKIVSMQDYLRRADALAAAGATADWA